MTKKDYKTLSRVLNIKECEIEAQQHPNPNLYAQMYYTITKRLIKAIRENDPKFDADKFLEETDK